MEQPTQAEALRLADELDKEAGRITQYTNRPGDLLREIAAAELRRLHAENESLRASQQAEPAGDARYRLLHPGLDKIAASDEFLSDDSVTWVVDHAGVFVGMVYQGGALLPARRCINAAIAAQP